MAFFKFLTAATPAGLVSIHLHYICLFSLPETGLLIRAPKTDAVPYYDSNGFETQALAKSRAAGLVTGLVTKACFNSCEGVGRNLGSARQSVELEAFSACQAPFSSLARPHRTIPIIRPLLLATLKQWPDGRGLCKR